MLTITQNANVTLLPSTSLTVTCFWDASNLNPRGANWSWNLSVIDLHPDIVRGDFLKPNGAVLDSVNADENQTFTFTLTASASLTEPINEFQSYIVKATANNN